MSPGVRVRGHGESRAQRNFLHAVVQKIQVGCSQQNQQQPIISPPQSFLKEPFISPDDEDDGGAGALHGSRFQRNHPTLIVLNESFSDLLRLLCLSGNIKRAE